MDKLDLEHIDEVIHGKIRLGVMAYLSHVNPAPYLELLEKTKATNGNLATHLKRLEGAGYIKLTKSFRGKRPHTSVSLTARGRDAWIIYLKEMKRLLEG